MLQLQVEPAELARSLNDKRRWKVHQRQLRKRSRRETRRRGRETNEEEIVELEGRDKNGTRDW